MASSRQTNPWQDLDSICHPLVLHAPKTWGDPLCSSSMAMPQNVQGCVGYVRRSLVDRPWRDQLVLLTAVMYSQNMQYKTVINTLYQLHRGFACLFPALNLTSMADWDVNKHLALYLSGQVVEVHTPKKRVTFWSIYQVASRRLKRWLGSLPTEQQWLYHPFVLPSPDDPSDLTRLAGSKQVADERQEKRKAETDALLPFYADLRAQAHLRYNMMLRLRKAYYKAIHTVEHGKGMLPLEFTLREGGNERGKKPATEQLVFTLWDRRTFVLEHGKKYPHLLSSAMIRAAQDQQGSFAPEKNTYLLEFLRAEALDETTPPGGLWFIELLEHDALGQTRSGTQQEREEKRAWLRTQGYGDEGDEGLHPFFARTPGILAPFQSTGDGLFTHFIHKRLGTLFIPVEPFYAAAAFGLVALHILTSNGMRIGELQQLRASSECILPVVVSPPPEAEDQTPVMHWAVRAIPKGHRTVKTYYLDDEHLRLLSLIKLMLCEHYGIDAKAGGDLPIVAMDASHAHRFPPDRYLFQYGHRCLPDHDLRVCLRFLVHGLVFQTLDGRRVSIKPHLPRHGFATWALNVAKEPIDIVAAILNQKNLDMTRYYGRPTPRTLAERSHGLMSRLSSYIDVDDLVLRSPQELRALLAKAQQTHGTLAHVRGGKCLLSGECPILFACIGCSAKVPDPAQRGEIEEIQHITLLQITIARKRGLTLEVAQHQKKLHQCQAELREMDMIEACREDEQREPEVNFEIDA